MIASVPLLIVNPSMEFSTGESLGTFRSEYHLGLELFQNNGPNVLLYFHLGRFCCIPFSLFGLYMCHQWAQRMLSDRTAKIAGLLWCFCPEFLAHGALMTPDVAASTAGVCLGYAIWNWMGEPSWRSTLNIALALSFCLLTKFTWLGFCIVLPFVMVFWEFRFHQLTQRAWQIALLAGVVLYMLNAQYYFSGTGATLRSINPTSALFKSFAQVQLLADIPIPLPKDLILGIDTQRLDFESEFWSYFCGTWQQHGWWNYYIVGLLMKVPMGCWLLFAIGLAAIVSRTLEHGIGTRVLLSLTIPSAYTILFVSSQTGFNHHIRYVLPVLPYLFVIAASAFNRAGASKNRIRRNGCCFLLIAYIGSSMSVFPHSLSYFNWIVGGPDKGHEYFSNSNVDWAQDLYLAQFWKWQNPTIAIDGYALIVPAEIIFPGSKSAPLTPAPGWYIVSRDKLCTRIPNHYSYFLRYPPHDRIGWSMLVYHIPTSTP